LACDALGADRVYGVSNPSAYSSEHSKSDAADLAARTGLHFTTVPIAPAVDAFHQMLELDGIAAENLQARIRAVIWMAESNQHAPSIVLACGNKSELAVGYSTIYGDAVGGYAPIKDVPKTVGLEVGALAQRASRAAWRDPADSGKRDHQGAERRITARPEGHRLAAAV
jgi:NAD+ synthase (glutamine-hydrolysing)